VARKRTDTVALTLRVREDLRRRLEREAKKRAHSLNTEMVRRLEDTFQPERDALVTLIAGNDSNATAMHMIAEAMMLAQTLRWQHSDKAEGYAEEFRAETDRALMIRAAVNLILTAWGNLSGESPGRGDARSIEVGRRLAYFVLERRYGPSRQRFEEELEQYHEDLRADMPDWYDEARAAEQERLEIDQQEKEQDKDK
jgi:hypothetical protein